MGPVPGGRPARGRLAALARFPLHHAGIIGLLGLGALLRALFVIAYQPAFWFYGDSGSYLRLAEQALEPHRERPLGFVLLLAALRPTGTLVSVVVVQHALTLLLALGVYALLRHRGVARWLACLAAVPLIFDSLVLTIGQFLLPDVLLTVFLAAGVLVLLWSPRPGAVACVAAGLLLAAAWFTKPVAMPVVLLLGLFLLVRRVGWWRFTAYAVAFLVPYVWALVWIGDRPSVYGSQSHTALYGRTAIISDCDRLKLTPEQRFVCPDQPLGERWDRADKFYWGRPERMSADWVESPEGVSAMRGFAIEVVKQQPLDYLRIVGKESAAHFIPGVYLGPLNECMREKLRPPVQFRDTVEMADRCAPSQASPDFQAPPTELATAPTATPLTRALHAYGGYTRGVPVVLSLSVLLTLAALAAGRRVAGRIRLDTVLLLIAGPGLVVFTVAIGMYEPRYALPALPLAVVAVALAAHGLLNRVRRPAAGPEAATGVDASPAQAS